MSDSSSSRPERPPTGPVTSTRRFYSDGSRLVPQSISPPQRRPMSDHPTLLEVRQLQQQETLARSAPRTLRPAPATGVVTVESITEAARALRGQSDAESGTAPGPFGKAREQSFAQMPGLDAIDAHLAPTREFSLTQLAADAALAQHLPAAMPILGGQVKKPQGLAGGPADLSHEQTTHYGLVAPPKDVWQAICEREASERPDATLLLAAPAKPAPATPSRRRLWALVGTCVLACGLLVASHAAKRGHFSSGRLKSAIAAGAGIQDEARHLGTALKAFALGASKAEPPKTAPTPASALPSQNVEAHGPAAPAPATPPPSEPSIEATADVDPAQPASTTGALDQPTPDTTVTARESTEDEEDRHSKESLMSQPHVAAELYIAGRYKEALAEYRMLAISHPKQKIYGDFARILRRRLVEMCVRTQPHRQTECNQL